MAISSKLSKTATTRKTALELLLLFCFLIKPTDIYQQMFNLEREILVLFSPYESFEPRTLDAIDQAAKQYQQLRLDRIVSILISMDSKIEEKIRRLLATERETQIVVPFTYKELMKEYDEYLMSNRFRDHFFSRDLFAYEAPLTKDLYFFGRTNLIQDMTHTDIHHSKPLTGIITDIA